MSQPRGYGLNGKSIYWNATKPEVTTVQFTVTPTNGLGVTSVKSNGYVNNVFMHTSTTPSVGNDSQTNPNPANGFALIQFTNNFNYYLSGYAQFQTPTATSTAIDNAALTVGAAYVITILGNATAAQWLAVGVPAGITPAVGVSFIALTTGAGGGTSTSRVQVPSSSGIYGVEIVGNPGVMLASQPIASTGGAWLLLKFLAPTFTAGAYTPAGTVAAPVFTGDALGNHAHNLLIKGGQAASTTNDVAMYAGPLIGKQEASDATVVGGSASNGGVQNASAGTPAGTNSAPAFTGTAASLTGTLAMAAAAPATGTVVRLQLVYDASSVTIDGL